MLIFLFRQNGQREFRRNSFYKRPVIRVIPCNKTACYVQMLEYFADSPTVIGEKIRRGGRSLENKEGGEQEK